MTPNVERPMPTEYAAELYEMYDPGQVETLPEQAAEVAIEMVNLLSAIKK